MQLNRIASTAVDVHRTNGALADDAGEAESSVGWVPVSTVQQFRFLNQGPLYTPDCYPVIPPPFLIDEPDDVSRHQTAEAATELSNLNMQSSITDPGVLRLPPYRVATPISLGDEDDSAPFCSPLPPAFCFTHDELLQAGRCSNANGVDDDLALSHPVLIAFFRLCKPQTPSENDASFEKIATELRDVLARQSTLFPSTTAKVATTKQPSSTSQHGGGVAKPKTSSKAAPSTKQATPAPVDASDAPIIRVDNPRCAMLSYEDAIGVAARQLLGGSSDCDPSNPPYPSPPPSAPILASPTTEVADGRGATVKAAQVDFHKCITEMTEQIVKRTELLQRKRQLFVGLQRSVVFERLLPPCGQEQSVQMAPLFSVAVTKGDGSGAVAASAETIVQQELAGEVPLLDSASGEAPSPSPDEACGDMSSEVMDVQSDPAPAMEEAREKVDTNRVCVPLRSIGDPKGIQLLDRPEWDASSVRDDFDVVFGNPTPSLLIATPPESWLQQARTQYKVGPFAAHPSAVNSQSLSKGHTKFAELCVLPNGFSTADTQRPPRQSAGRIKSSKERPAAAVSQEPTRSGSAASTQPVPIRTLPPRPSERVTSAARIETGGHMQNQTAAALGDSRVDVILMDGNVADDMPRTLPAKSSDGEVELSVAAANVPNTAASLLAAAEVPAVIAGEADVGQSSGRLAGGPSDGATERTDRPPSAALEFLKPKRSNEADLPHGLPPLTVVFRPFAVQSSMLTGTASDASSARVLVRFEQLRPFFLRPPRDPEAVVDEDEEEYWDDAVEMLQQAMDDEVALVPPTPPSTPLSWGVPAAEKPFVPAPFTQLMIDRLEAGIEDRRRDDEDDESDEDEEAASEPPISPGMAVPSVTPTPIAAPAEAPTKDRRRDSQLKRQVNDETGEPILAEPTQAAVQQMLEAASVACKRMEEERAARLAALKEHLRGQGMSEDEEEDALMRTMLRFTSPSKCNSRVRATPLLLTSRPQLRTEGTTSVVRRLMRRAKRDVLALADQSKKAQLVSFRPSRRFLANVLRLRSFGHLVVALLTDPDGPTPDAPVSVDMTAFADLVQPHVTASNVGLPPLTAGTWFHLRKELCKIARCQLNQDRGAAVPFMFAPDPLRSPVPVDAPRAARNAKGSALVDESAVKEDAPNFRHFLPRPLPLLTAAGFPSKVPRSATAALELAAKRRAPRSEQLRGGLDTPVPIPDLSVADRVARSAGGTESGKHLFAASRLSLRPLRAPLVAHKHGGLADPRRASVVALQHASLSSPYLLPAVDGGPQTASGSVPEVRVPQLVYPLPIIDGAQGPSGATVVAVHDSAGLRAVSSKGKVTDRRDAAWTAQQLTLKHLQQQRFEELHSSI